jgi:hypothetical protein
MRRSGFGWQQPRAFVWTERADRILLLETPWGYLATAFPRGAYSEFEPEGAVLAAQGAFRGTHRVRVAPVGMGGIRVALEEASGRRTDLILECRRRWRGRASCYQSTWALDAPPRRLQARWSVRRKRGGSVRWGALAGAVVAGIVLGAVAAGARLYLEKRFLAPP